MIWHQCRSRPVGIARFLLYTTTLLWISSTPARAATVIVHSTSGAVVASPGDGTCASAASAVESITARTSQNPITLSSIQEDQSYGLIGPCVRIPNHLAALTNSEHLTPALDSGSALTRSRTWRLILVDLAGENELLHRDNLNPASATGFSVNFNVKPFSRLFTSGTWR